ncbi:YoaK family protein [Flavobacterium sp. JP2137]|uniref:YoaK family protein n=1 Tax=Flavobacterium sp. JP2137 TaxID=3414510 RepID=UPI003D2FA553
MLSSKGGNRTFKHNLLLAVFFAFVAGIINVFGFYEFATFATNLTGHVGELALALAKNAPSAQLIQIVSWIGCFALGSFIASLCTNFFAKRNIKFSYVLPILLEICLLTTCIYLPENYELHAIIDLELLLLFAAMGLQNGIVSMVSGNVVRTTHLTGMVTDFGIGLGEIIMRKKGKRKSKIRKIQLTLSIIFSFALGAILAAFLVPYAHHQVLWIPILLLLILLFYDYKILEKSVDLIRERLQV